MSFLRLSFRGYILKNSKTKSDCLFLILDEFFGDVDAYTEDEGLLAENSDFYLNENMFRERAKNILNRLVC
ncbi:colicin immunity domain-containing protein [Pseudomonas solani]|uniref:colicin immunity domain-containing protein n=1 Tax=Pseudomonas solani TaxID=2731552 RepID=UPI003F4AC2DE